MNMKTNISIDLNDQQRSHLAGVFHGKASKTMISRKELNDLMQLMVNDLLNLDVGAPREVVTERISREGFSYRFNGVEVSEEQYEGGIQAWLGVEA